MRRGPVLWVGPMRTLLLLAGLLAGCAGALAPVAPQERPRPTTFRTYDNAHEPEEPDCYQTGPCDKYELQFPAGQQVRIELWSATASTVLIVDQGGGLEQRATGTPQAPAVIELADGADGAVRILAAAADRYALGDYQLVVGPEPAAELTLPDPKVPWETRLAGLLADHPAQPEFAISHKEGKRRLAAELGGFEAVELDREAALHGFAPVDVPVEAGYCYRISWSLREGASYSELATRGLDASVDTPDHRGLGTGPLIVLGPYAVTPRFCAEQSGDARLTVTASLAPPAHAAELGTGGIALSLHREPFWPGLQGAAKLKETIAEYTRGHTAGKKVKADLGSFDKRPFPVKRGKCYVVVFRLGADADWSQEAREHNIAIDFDGEDETVSAGPGVVGRGAVSALGCPQRSQTYQLSVFALGQDAPLGAGTVTMQVYTRSARKGELQRDARETAEQIEQSREDDERRKREHCAKCRKDHWGDQQAFESCAAQWYSRDACY